MHLTQLSIEEQLSLFVRTCLLVTTMLSLLCHFKQCKTSSDLKEVVFLPAERHKSSRSLARSGSLTPYWKGSSGCTEHEAGRSKKGQSHCHASLFQKGTLRYTLYTSHVKCRQTCPFHSTDINSNFIS